MLKLGGGREAVKKAFCTEVSQHITINDVVRTDLNWNKGLVFQNILNPGSINSITILKNLYSSLVHKLVPLFFTTLVEDTLLVARCPQF